MSPNRFFVSDIPRRRFLELGLKGGIVLAAAPSLLRSALAADPSPSALMTVDPGLLDRTIRRALEKGGEFADVYLEHRISRTILMEEGKFKSAVFGISQGAGVRVIAGDKTGYAYTDEVTEEKLLRAADVASTVARGTPAAKPVDVREEKRPSFIAVKVPLGTVADEKRLEIVRRAHDAALAYDGRIKLASVSYQDEVRNGKLETAQEAASYGVGCRVFVGGRMAFASSNDFGERALDDAVRRAVAFAKITTADPNNVLPDDSGSTPVEGLYDPEIARVPMDKKIELAIAVEKIALATAGVTKSAGAGYGEGEGEVFLANSRGLGQSAKSSSCSFGVSVVAEKGDQ